MPRIIPIQGSNIPTNVTPGIGQAIGQGLSESVAPLLAQQNQFAIEEEKFRLAEEERRQKQEAVDAVLDKNVWRQQFEYDVRKNYDPEDYLDILEDGENQYDNEHLSGKSQTYTSHYKVNDKIPRIQAMGTMGTNMRTDILNNEKAGLVRQLDKAIKAYSLNPVEAGGSFEMIRQTYIENGIIPTDDIDAFISKSMSAAANEYFEGLAPLDAMHQLADEDNPTTALLSFEEKNRMMERSEQRFNNEQNWATINIKAQKNKIHNDVTSNAWIRNFNEQQSVSWIFENVPAGAQRDFAMSVNDAIYADKPAINEELSKVRNTIHRESIAAISSRIGDLVSMSEGSNIGERKASASSNMAGVVESADEINDQLIADLKSGQITVNDYFNHSFELSAALTDAFDSAQGGSNGFFGFWKKNASPAFLAVKQAGEFSRKPGVSRADSLLFKNSLYTEIIRNSDAPFQNESQEGASLEAIKKANRAALESLAYSKGIIESKAVDKYVESMSYPQAGNVMPKSVADSTLRTMRSLGNPPSYENIVQVALGAGMTQEQARAYADANYSGE